MKRTLLSLIVIAISSITYGQTQLGNGDMEAWANNDEPDNWNSFLTGSGTWSGFAGDQCDASTDVRPCSASTRSCLIWSNDVLGTLANGNVTLGRIEMGSTTPTSPDNYNYSVTADTDFSEALTDSPDSIVFWAKFIPGGGTVGNARMKATLHTNYDYRDPEDAAAAAEVVATAVLNYPETGGNWMRFSVAFDYSGPATGHEYILVTFTTNEGAGQGNDNDQVWIDDVELIYNSIASTTDTDGDGVIDADEITDGTSFTDCCDFILASATVTPSANWDGMDCDNDGVLNGDEITNGTDPLVTVKELTNGSLEVSLNQMNETLTVKGLTGEKTSYIIYNSLSQIVQSGSASEQIDFRHVPGVYFIQISDNESLHKFEVLKF